MAKGLLCFILSMLFLGIMYRITECSTCPMESSWQCKGLCDMDDPDFCYDEHDCIPMKFVCDGYPDCLDGSDEDFCKVSCAHNSSFHCANGNCIHSERRCDYRVHCSKDNSDTSDEDGCDYHLKNFTCGSEYYSCKSNRFECYKRSARCDLMADCSDRSDEIDCENDNCTDNEFLCLNTGICIDRLWTCDGQNDCGDYSDEHFCGDNKTCFDGYFTCNNNHCVKTSFVCDGEDDCHDNSDENLPDCQPPPCKSNGFLCENSTKCIPREWICDDHYDCSDGLDEIGCTYRTCDGYQCSYGPCISRKKVCDGISDCSFDRDDEALCELTCKPGYYRCSNVSFQCYQDSEMCDGKRDCKDGYDEPAYWCPYNLCLVNNGGCSQICTWMKPLRACSCFPGYKQTVPDALLPNCYDINECDETIGLCSQKCINTVGSYHCQCAPEYPHDDGDGLCRTWEAGRILLFTNNSFLGVKMDSAIDSKFPDENENIVYLSSNISVGSGHSFDFIDNTVYWTDSSQTMIYRMRLDQPNTVQVIKSNLESVFDIAIDWIGRNIYWSNPRANSIHVCDLHGNNDVVLLNNLHSPMVLVVQPNKGGNLLYWSEIGNIFCIDMDGYLNSKRVIFSSKHVRPETLVFDFDYLYWTDIKFIYSVRNDGKHFRKLFRIIRNVPFTLTVFEENVYWREGAYIMKANKFTGKKVSRVIANTSGVTMMSYFHKALQPQDQKKCNIYLCSHLCLLSNRHDYTCACPHDHQLLADNATCTLSQCTNDFCLNGGTCLERPYPVCVCKEGFSGRICQERDGLVPRYQGNNIVGYICTDAFCLNGGRCFATGQQPFTPLCRCMDGYQGERCADFVGDTDIKIYVILICVMVFCIIAAFLVRPIIRKCRLSGCFERSNQVAQQETDHCFERSNQVAQQETDHCFKRSNQVAQQETDHCFERSNQVAQQKTDHCFKRSNQVAQQETEIVYYVAPFILERMAAIERTDGSI